MDRQLPPAFDESLDVFGKVRGESLQNIEYDDCQTNPKVVILDLLDWEITLTWTPDGIKATADGSVPDDR